MNAASGSSTEENGTGTGGTKRGLRAWWRIPPRRGLQRVIIPWEYRHLRFFGVARITGGCVAIVPGLICLAYDVPAWAAFFLVISALNLAGGCWYLSIDRAAPAAS